MTEVYKAMLALNCTWHATNNYRVLCMRYFTAEGSGQGRLGEDLSDPQGGGDPGGSVFRDSKVTLQGATRERG